MMVCEAILHCLDHYPAPGFAQAGSDFIINARGGSGSSDIPGVGNERGSGAALYLSGAMVRGVVDGSVLESHVFCIDPVALEKKARRLCRDAFGNHRAAGGRSHWTRHGL